MVEKPDTVLQVTEVRDPAAPATDTPKVPNSSCLCPYKEVERLMVRMTAAMAEFDLYGAPTAKEEEGDANHL